MPHIFLHTMCGTSMDILGVLIACIYTVNIVFTICNCLPSDPSYFDKWVLYVNTGCCCIGCAVCFLLMYIVCNCKLWELFIHWQLALRCVVHMLNLVVYSLTHIYTHLYIITSKAICMLCIKCIYITMYGLRMRCVIFCLYFLLTIICCKHFIVRENEEIKSEQ